MRCNLMLRSGLVGMKFIFKKYMDYEIQYGDDASIEQVKQKAMDYVSSKM